jgi:hypothetical protein
MTRIIIAALLALTIAGTASKGQSKDKDYNFTDYGLYSCGAFLGAYSKTTLLENGKYKGPYEYWRLDGWIDGYLTGYNEFANNGKSSILGSMSYNDARRWLASWCRDNPSKGLWDSLNALTNKLER